MYFLLNNYVYIAASWFFIFILEDGNSALCSHTINPIKYIHSSRVPIPFLLHQTYVINM